MWRLRSTGGELTVGLVHWALPPTIGGVESHLADYIRLLAARSIRVIVFSGEEKPSADIMGLAEFRYHRLLHLAGCGVTPDDRPEDAVELTKWFTKELESSKVDVIHGHNLHYFSSAPATALNEACLNLGIARHHTYHNYWGGATHFADLIASWEGRWSNSEFVARLCADGYRGGKPRTQYLGINPDRFTCSRMPFEKRDPKAERPDQAPVILQPARLLPWKGPIASVEMLRRLHKEGYCARLVLTDTQALIDWDDERKALRSQLDDLINEYDLSEWVEFKDKIYYGDMPSLYNEADIVINPSHGEPLGLVALEAMAASRPVVVTDSGGMTETFAARTGAVVADDGNLDEHLFDAVSGFLRNPRDAVKAGRQGREHVVKNFHMDTYVDAILNEYWASRAPTVKTWRAVFKTGHGLSSTRSPRRRDLASEARPADVSDGARPGRVSIAAGAESFPARGDVGE